MTEPTKVHRLSDRVEIHEGGDMPGLWVGGTYLAFLNAYSARSLIEAFQQSTTTERSHADPCCCGG